MVHGDRSILGGASHPGHRRALKVHAPAGAGKKTRIMALLREIFGAGVEKVGEEVCAMCVCVRGRYSY